MILPCSPCLQASASADTYIVFKTAPSSCGTKIQQKQLLSVDTYIFLHMLLTVDAYVVSELNSRLHWGLHLSFQLHMTANAIRYIMAS